MLALSDKWASYLNNQPEAGMGYQLATICLIDGRKFEQVLIAGGEIIRIGSSTHILFVEAEIERMVVTNDKDPSLRSG